MNKQYTLYAIIGFSIMGLFSAYNLIASTITIVKFQLSLAPLLWNALHTTAYVLVLLFFVHLYKTQKEEQ